VAFLASALVGAVLERGVIRFLYGRPLETLLATFGISLVLQQTVRSRGAERGRGKPRLDERRHALLPNLTLPYNRIAIIVFAFAVLAGVAFMIARTRLGLFVRGVTQNRAMASCVGVNTARTDTYAFALGSGIAGLAGCALSQIGNVGPDLGQNYIVDSFWWWCWAVWGSWRAPSMRLWAWACSASCWKAGPAPCWPRSPCCCSSWSSFKSVRKASLP
jgi:urea transport system permease protein